MFLQEPPIPTFQIDLSFIFNMLKDNFLIGIIAAFIVVIFLYGKNLGGFIKDYYDKRVELETKKLDESYKLNDKHFQLYQKNTEAVDKIGEAISSFEKAFVGSEARTGEKIQVSESRITEKILTSEARLADRISLISIKDN